MIFIHYILSILSIFTIFTQSKQLSIPNWGFEDDQSSANSFIYGNNIIIQTSTSWKKYNQDWNLNNAWALAVNPSEGTSFINTGSAAKEGTMCVGLDNNDVSKNGQEFGIMTRNSGNNALTDKVIADHTYTLKVNVGNPASNIWSSASTNGGGFYNLTGWPGYRIELLALSKIIAVDDNTLNPLDGEWTESVISFTAPAANPCTLVDGTAYNCIGKKLRVRLINLNDAINDGDGVYADSNVVFFDNVRLEETLHCIWCDSYEPNLSQCIADSGDWTLVRAMGPAQTTWYDNFDNLQGTDDAVNNAVTEQFNIGSFSETVPGFNQYLFISGDCTAWLISGKEEVNPLDGSNNGVWYSNNDRWICSSSMDTDPYEAKWYYRVNCPEDPWITIKDHGGSAYADFVYGEANNAARASTIADKNGMFVYIRNAGGLDANGCTDGSATTVSPTKNPSQSPSKSPTSYQFLQHSLHRMDRALSKILIIVVVQPAVAVKV